MRWLRLALVLALSLMLSALISLLLAGCASSAMSGNGENSGSANPPLMSLNSDPWTFRGTPAQRLKTEHYLIYTTISDPQTLAQLPVLMEGALLQYRKLAADVPISDRPMECYIFKTRKEWNQFTSENTGHDAKIYLQIRKGGYTIGDRYVAYYIGASATASVAAHEGWHQYVARHFKGRLPPFLEEGMACMFEGVAWSEGQSQPRWDLTDNPIRLMELKKTIQYGTPWPLEKLVRMHAGEVVDLPGEKIEAFYAQSWAFARFLWEANHGQHRPAFQRWIAETAAGQPFDPSHSHSRTGIPWNPDGVRPMMEHYLNEDFHAIDAQYQKYVFQLVYFSSEDTWKD